jgi:hypothetical protein
MRIGVRARDDLRDTLGAYYGYTPEYAERMIATAPSDAAAVERAIESYAAAGAGELIFFPASRDLLQVELLSEVASMG